MIPTVHSIRRLRQRSISWETVELLEQFGTSVRCGDGEKFFFDGAARRRLTTAYGSGAALRLEHRSKVYVVVGDNGKLVTAAYRTRRIRKK